MGAAGGGEVKKGEEKVRVLVVDDSPVDRRIVELLLRNYKAGAATFHVTAVDSGKKAMELLGLKDSSSAAADANDLTVDIVLTDYCMPEMTGYDLLKAIKASSSPNPIPVVVMSSENEPQRISRCLTAGAEDFILKPLKTKDVQRLRSCSNARPKDTDAGSHCERLSRRKLPSSDHSAKKAASEQRSHLTGLAMAWLLISTISFCSLMTNNVSLSRCSSVFACCLISLQVLNASGIGLPHYFQFLFKFILLAYALLFVGELLHRWSNGCFLSQWCA